MLIAGCSGSTQLRRSSSEQTSFFFHPLELHLQPADLLVQCFGVEFIVASFPGTTIHKGLLQLLQGRFPPVRNLHRMHLNCDPNWLSVFSPRMASNATRALNFAL